MSTSPTTALDRARGKAYIRLLPLLFVSYAIAYVDRINVSLAKLEMSKDLPGFNNKVIGFGAGVFFIGYFLLEIPGTLLVEKWSARKWISRIMISWGIVAAMTAFIHYRVPGVTWLAELTVGESPPCSSRWRIPISAGYPGRASRLSNRFKDRIAHLSCSFSRYDSFSVWPRQGSSRV